eukprot:PhM_4_TR5349/c0_g1_i1/m.32585
MSLPTLSAASLDAELAGARRFGQQFGYRAAVTAMSDACISRLVRDEALNRRDLIEAWECDEWSALQQPTCPAFTCSSSSSLLSELLENAESLRRGDLEELFIAGTHSFCESARHWRVMHQLFLEQRVSLDTRGVIGVGQIELEEVCERLVLVSLWQLICDEQHTRETIVSHEQDVWCSLENAIETERWAMSFLDDAEAFGRQHLLEGEADARCTILSLYFCEMSERLVIERDSVVDLLEVVTTASHSREVAFTSELRSLHQQRIEAVASDESSARHRILEQEDDAMSALLNEVNYTLDCEVVFDTSRADIVELESVFRHTLDGLQQTLYSEFSLIHQNVATLRDAMQKDCVLQINAGKCKEILSTETSVRAVLSQAELSSRSVLVESLLVLQNCAALSASTTNQLWVWLDDMETSHRCRTVEEESEERDDVMFSFVAEVHKQSARRARVMQAVQAVTTTKQQTVPSEEARQRRCLQGLQRDEWGLVMSWFRSSTLTASAHVGEKTVPAAPRITSTSSAINKPTTRQIPSVAPAARKKPNPKRPSKSRSRSPSVGADAVRRSVTILDTAESESPPLSVRVFSEERSQPPPPTFPWASHHHCEALLRKQEQDNAELVACVGIVKESMWHCLAEAQTVGRIALEDCEASEASAMFGLHRWCQRILTWLRDADCESHDLLYTILDVLTSCEASARRMIVKEERQLRAIIEATRHDAALYVAQRARTSNGIVSLERRVRADLSSCLLELHASLLHPVLSMGSFAVSATSTLNYNNKRSSHKEENVLILTPKRRHLAIPSEPQQQQQQQELLPSPSLRGDDGEQRAPQTECSRFAGSSSADTVHPLLPRLPSNPIPPSGGGRTSTTPRRSVGR